MTDNKPKLKNRLIRWLKLLGITLVIGYALLLALLVTNETSLVYPGSKYPRGNWQPDEFTFEEIEFESGDGTRLVAWYMPHAQGTARNTILVCHGNGENVAQSSAYTGRNMMICLEANVLVYDYRGYGKSEGVPDEAGLKLDAEAALKLLNEKTGTKPEDVIIVGHSLGGGPAVHLAAKHGAKALVLQRTFSSLIDAGQYNYPWVPVSLLMRNRFESASIADRCKMPVFQSHGDNDSVVPIQSARKLHQSLASKEKFFYEVPGMGHYDALPNEYWSMLRRFIDSASVQ